MKNNRTNEIRNKKGKGIRTIKKKRVSKDVKTLRSKLIKSFIILYFIFSFIIPFLMFLYPDTSYSRGSWMEVLLDVDRWDDGTTVVTSTPVVSQTPFAHLPYINVNQSKMHAVYAIDKNGKKLWEIPGLAFPHEIENGTIRNRTYYFIADTESDQIRMYDQNLQERWDFNPKDINWTEINPEWDSDSYYMNPINYDWTHINDVDYIYGKNLNQTFDSLLISIRNFNLTILINFTAEYEEYLSGDKIANTKNVYWWFGPGIINHQHNPDVLPSGNIVICDSVNNRIIEINRTTKEIVWESKSANGINYLWPRDADYNPKHDSYLITDSGNNRIIEISKDGKVLFNWKKDLALPYEADILSNGHYLLSGSVSGYIIEVDPTLNQVVWEYNVDLGKDYYIINGYLVWGMISALLIFWSKNKLPRNIKKIKYREEKWKKTIMTSIIGITLLVFSIIRVIWMKEFVYSNYYRLLVITTLISRAKI